jgi:hypothetical protein
MLPQGHSAARACALWAALLIVGQATWGHAAEPAAKAEVRFTNHDTYDITISCDATAYVAQSKPGSAGADASAAFKSLPTYEIRSKIELARKALAEELKLEFDGQAAPAAKITFPSVEELREALPATATAPVSQRIVLNGVVPLNALKFRIGFPPQLGAVDLTLQAPKRERLRQTLESGALSEPFLLKEVSPETTAGARRFAVYAVLVAILLVLLGFRAFRPRTIVEDRVE